MRSTSLNRLKRLEEHLSTRGKVNITFNDTSFVVHGDQENRYIPTKTGEKFHQNDDLVRLLIGPYGSGKSSACCAEIVKRACEMPRWLNGVRRSKWAIIRNTSGELESTTLPTWLSWFGDLGSISKRKKPILTLEHKFNDGNGMVELQLLFMALDKKSDLGKLRSLELTACYLNEISEIPEGALTHLKGRINRYPATRQSDKYWNGIIADTNPPRS